MNGTYRSQRAYTSHHPYRRQDRYYNLPNQILVLGDSMARGLRRLNGTDVLFIPGAIIQHITQLITSQKHKDRLCLDKRRVIFMLIGTNNLGNGNTPCFIQKQIEILLNCMRKKNNCQNSDPQHPT